MAGCSTGVGRVREGGRCSRENGKGLPHRSSITTPSCRAKGHLQGPQEGEKEGGSEACTKGTNDDPACPTPQMGWLPGIPESHYESCFLYSAKRTITVPDSHPVNRSVSQAVRRLIPIDLDGARDRQQAEVEHAQRRQKLRPKHLVILQPILSVIFFVFLH